MPLPRGAEQHEELALLDLDRDVVDDRKRLIPLGHLVECDGHETKPAGPSGRMRERLLCRRFCGQSQAGNKTVTAARFAACVSGSEWSRGPSGIIARLDRGRSIRGVGHGSFQCRAGGRRRCRRIHAGRGRPGPGSPSAGGRAVGRLSQEELLAPRGAQLPDAPVLRRHPRPHRRLDGRRRLRRPPGPADAFRFAGGEEITAANGMRVKLARPLDFIVVADHSDNMGFFPKLFAGDPAFLADPTGKRWYDDDPEGRRGRRQGGDRGHRRVLQGHIPAGAGLAARHARPIDRPGKSTSRLRRTTTSPAGSRPSSASSGPRTPAATTCTAS